MKKIRKTFVPVMAMLVIGILTLVGVTYAWFNEANESEVSSMNVDVVEATGILVSWDATTWKSTIAVNDTEYSATGNTNTVLSGLKLAPVSTAGGVDSGVLKFYQATLDNNQIKNSVVVDQAGNKYIKYDIYFSSTEAKNIYLDGTTVTGADSEIELASRIAFLVQGTDATFTPGTAKGLTGATASKIIEPNATTHTADGLADGAVAGNKHAYLGLDGTFDGPIPRKTVAADQLAAVTTTEISEHTSTTVSTPSPTPAFEIGAGITKVTVYIWVEGQDADCTNFVAGKPLTVNLKFKAVPVPQS